MLYKVKEGNMLDNSSFQCVDKDCVTRVLKMIHEEQAKMLYAPLNYVKEQFRRGILGNA